MKPIHPVALILWHYQQGSQLTTEERSQLQQWLALSEERRLFFSDLANQKEWLRLTLFEFLSEYEYVFDSIRSRLTGTVKA